MDLMQPDNKYGLLLSPDIKIHRKYFEEMVKLMGIQVVYYAPRPGKRYTTYDEVKDNYQAPEVVGVIFDEHPDQKSMKKLFMYLMIYMIFKKTHYL